jgi:hypothetical protein
MQSASLYHYTRNTLASTPCAQGNTFVDDLGRDLGALGGLGLVVLVADGQQVSAGAVEREHGCRFAGCAPHVCQYAVVLVREAAGVRQVAL